MTLNLLICDEQPSEDECWIMKCHYTFNLLWNFSAIERGKERERKRDRNNLWNMLTIETVCQYKGVCYTNFWLFLYTSYQ